MNRSWCTYCNNLVPSLQNQKSECSNALLPVSYARAITYIKKNKLISPRSNLYLSFYYWSGIDYRPPTSLQFGLVRFDYHPPHFFIFPLFNGQWGVYSLGGPLLTGVSPPHSLRWGTLHSLGSSLITGSLPRFFDINQDEDCIFPPNLSMSSMSSSLHTSASGILSFVWSPPLVNTSGWIIRKVLHTVLSVSIDSIAASTHSSARTSFTLSRAGIKHCPFFKLAWWSLFTITISFVPWSFDRWRYSTCPTCIGSKYPEQHTIRWVITKCVKLIYKWPL